MITDAPNNNRLWADLIVEELVRNGIDTFCLAPGSRSTPLVTAVAARTDCRRIVHFDERGLAFFALGYARATGKPAAVITTSGTAVANLMPAVVEASLEGVPMLLLTADRPPELRDTGANQAIDQVKIFGGYTRWHFDLPAPDISIPPQAVLTTIDQAVYRNLRSPAGPVHLNCMFREPLAPTPAEGDRSAYLAAIEPWLNSSEPYTHYVRSKAALDDEEIRRLAEAFSGIEHGLIVLGKTDAVTPLDAVQRLVERLGWPVLSDIGSGLRLGQGGGFSVPYFDQVLLSPSFADEHAPEAVLHLGGRVTSKRLAQILERSQPRIYATVRDLPFRSDPSHQVTHAIEADLASFCEQMAEALPTSHRNETWLKSWQQASQVVDEQIDTFFQKAGSLSEPLVARLVSQHIPEGNGLVLAASMPVRDMDMYARADGLNAKVAANRGASGIDGTVATAAGFQQGLGRPVTLIIGDLALLHDLNGLALLRDRPVVVVAINNDGGGIFSFLPIAKFEEVFEPYFGTPHGLSFKHAAAMFGLRYTRPDSVDAFITAYTAACAAPTTTLIEVVTDRKQNTGLHRELQQFIAEGLINPNYL